MPPTWPTSTARPTECSRYWKILGYLAHGDLVDSYCTDTGVLWKRQGGYDIDPFGGDLSIPDESTRAGPVTRTALVLIIVLVVLFVGVCLTVVCCIYHCSRRTASRTISGGGGNG